MDAEQKLRLVERELANLRQEYEEYCAAVSHDFSGPIRTMGGFSEMLLRRNESVFDEKSKRFTGIMMTAAKDSKAMLDVMREYSILQRSNAEFTSFECGAAVADALDDLSELTNISGAEISCDPLPDLIGDKEQIRLVFYHLLKNALLYRHPTDTPHVNISYQDMDDVFSFRVVDNGIGIPEKMDERIFQILKRVVVPSEYPGHGMGLAIAKKVVQRHGGTIQLLRDMPQKTVFSFTLAKQPIDI